MHRKSHQDDKHDEVITKLLGADPKNELPDGQRDNVVREGSENEKAQKQGQI